MPTVRISRDKVLVEVHHSSSIIDSDGKAVPI